MNLGDSRISKVKVKSVSLSQMKELFDRDSTIKMRGGYFYNQDTSYHINSEEGPHSMTRARDYYFNLENRTIKITDKELIKELIWTGQARSDLRDGKLLYNGLVKNTGTHNLIEGMIYDGGEFAKQEYAKYDAEVWKRWQESYSKNVIRIHNSVLEDKAREALEEYRVKITREAKEKAHRVAERMVKLTGPNEINMEGVNFIGREDDSVIRDVYISDKQKANPSICKVLDGGRATGKKLKEQGKYRVAWIHSHANMSPFHSGTDEWNIGNLSGFFGKRINLEVDTIGFLSHTKIFVYPSLVFNARRSEPYVQVCASYLNPAEIDGGTRQMRYLRREAPLTSVNEHNGIDLSTRTIDLEIMGKVTWPEKSLESIENMLLKYAGEDSARRAPIVFPKDRTVSSLAESSVPVILENEKYQPYKPKSFLEITDGGNPIRGVIPQKDSLVVSEPVEERKKYSHLRNIRKWLSKGLYKFADIIFG